MKEAKPVKKPKQPHPSTGGLSLPKQAQIMHEIEKKLWEEKQKQEEKEEEGTIDADTNQNSETTKKIG